MAKQIIDVQYVQVLDRLYVFEIEPFEIQYGSDVTRVYVVDESYEGFKELNPDTPLKTFNPEAIQAGYPEWYEYVLSVIDSESNSELLAILYDAGLIANESYATLAEIRAINSSQFADAFATADTLTQFDEFEMFTGVKKLPDYMFQGWPNLESITFPESVYKLGKNVLAGCNSLDSVKVDGNNPKYYSPEGSNLIVDKTTRTIVAGCGNSTIPNDVYYIGDYAFANSDLIDIVIPKNIREIGDHAFDGCSALEHAEFESTNPPKIGSDVFDNVQPDFEIDVPEGAEDDYVDAWPEYADLIHGGEPQPHPEDLPDSEFGLESSTITITDTTTTVTIPLVNTHDLPVTYASSDTSVAVVNQSGVVTLSYNNGNANLTVAFAGSDEYKAKTLTYRVTVAIPQNLTDQEFGLASSSITIDDETDTVTLPLINIYNLPVTYTSSNQNVAIVSNNGNVTLTYANGSANITISFAGNALYNAKTLTYAITVAIPQELSDAELSWSASSATATQAGTFSGVTLTNTHGLAVAYSSSNTNVATIEPTYGHVIVSGNGSTTITAAFAGNAQYKPKTVTYTLTVAIPQVLPDNEFGLESSDITITSNTMPVIIPLVNTHNLPVTYTSDDTSVATVNGNGAVTLTYDNGTAHISVAFAGNSEYQAKTVTYTVNVAIPQELSDQELGLSSEGISIDDSSETVTLPIVNVYNLPLTYTSDDTSIASVDGNGNVTLTYENGRANIYIEFAGNAQYASKGLIYTIDVDIVVPDTYTIKVTTNLTSSSYNKYTGTVLYDSGSHSPGYETLQFDPSTINKIKIDNSTEITPEDTDDSVYFIENSGEHIIEYSFKDPTSLPPYMFKHVVGNAFPLKLKGCALPSQTIEIAEGIEAIPTAFFVECYVKKIILPSTINSIGNSNFHNCKKLGTVIINATTPPTLNGTQFYGAGAREADGTIPYAHPNIYVPDESVDLYKAAEGWSDHASYIKPISQIGQGTHYIIQVGTISDGQNASQLFNGDKYSTQSNLMMASLLSTNNDPNFDDSLFWQDVNELYINDKEVDIVTGPTYTFSYAGTYNVNYQFAYANVVPDAMFSYCEDIKSTYMLDGIEKINAYAFNQCQNLESVYLPETVTYIGSYAFYNDSGNPISYFDMTSYNPPVLGVNVFGETAPEVIHVPEERVSYYKEAQGWSDYSENINPEPAVINYVTAAFNVTETPGIVKLYNDSSNIKSIEVDGRLEEGLPPGYDFETTGRHEVKYELKDDTTISQRMFTECYFDELYLPDSITTIGDNALNNQNITELEIPKNVTAIGENLAIHCDKLTSLVIRSEWPLSIGQGLLAFNNTIIGNLTLPQSLRSLGSLVYYSAKKPSYVSLLVTDIATLQKNLACEQIKTQINKQVRLVDENLNEIFDVVIPEDTAANPSVAAYAFYKCSRVKTITFNNATPPTLGTDAFGNMTALTAIYVPKNSVDAYKTAWSSYANIIQAIPDPTVVATVNVNDTTTDVGLVNNSQLNKVKKMVIDGETLSSPVSTYQFDTTGDHTVEIYMKDNTTIPAEFFAAGNNRYTSIEMDDTVSSIGDAAFRGCSLLTSFEVPPLVTTLGSQMFQNCTSLTTVVLPNGFVSLGNWTLQGCSALANINLPEGMTSLGYTTLRGTALTSITIPSTMTNITTAFQYCNSLAEITCLATTPPTLNSGGLDHNSELTRTIYVPAASVDTYKAASGWSDYASEIQAIPEIIDFADSTVKSLCVQNWDTNGDGELDTTEAAAVNSLGAVFKQNTTITSFNELSYFTGLTTISNRAFSGCSNITSITLPETITTIENDAFSESPKLTYINIPSGVTYIGAGTFFHCTTLNNITIPQGVTTIGKHTFNACFAFTEVILPENLTSIGDYAFETCTGLTEITIPSYVTSIGNSAFHNCSYIETITCLATTPPTLKYDTLAGTTALTAIYVPAASVDVYKAASRWSSYANIIQAIPQAGYTINYSIKAIQSKDDPDYYQDIINEWAFTTYDEQTGESNFSKEDFDAVIDSISLDGVKIDVETAEDLRRTFTEEGLHNVELNLVGPTVPSNIFSSIAVYECHVGEGITTIGRSAFTEGWDQTTGGKLYLPSTITEFQDMPFTMCGVFKLYMAGSTPPVYNAETEGTSLFESEYIIIFVPDAAVDTYKAHPTWAPYASNIRGLSAAKTNLSDADFGFYIDDDHIQDYYDATINDPANNTSFGLDYFTNSYNVEYTLEYDDTMFTVDMWNWFTVIDTNRWTSASNTYTITIKFNGDDAFNAKTLTYNITTELPEEEPEE